jgi:hypothetical protein
MEYIRPIIDESDYYIVITKGRYGSLSPDGMSYTEKEFRYAQDKKIPAMAFLYKDMAKLRLSDTDQDSQKMDKLEAFRAELESKRIVKYWETADEVVSQVKDSVNDIVRRKPAIGWIRGDQGFDPAVYKELEALRKENESIKKRLDSSTDEISFPPTISHGNDVVQIKFTTYNVDKTSKKYN